MNSVVEQLFEDYKHYRHHTANYIRVKKERPYFREMKLRADRAKALKEMELWCRRKGVDPRWWLYSLFSSREWVAAPKFEQLVPKTKRTEKKALARYEALQEAPLYAQQITNRIQQDRRDQYTTYDPNRDISGTVENIKRRYLSEHDAQRCVDEMSSVTFGYHPKSLVCARCPLMTECEARLRKTVPFDIVALRRGDITIDEAKRAYHGR